MMDNDTLEVVKIRLIKHIQREIFVIIIQGLISVVWVKGYIQKKKNHYPLTIRFYRCKLMKVITKSAKGTKRNPKVDSEFMDGLSRFEKSQILGFQRRVDMFLRSGSVLKSGHYDAPLSVGDIGYNVGMEKYKEIEENFIESLQDFNHSTIKSALATFPQLWISNKDYEKHYNKRKNIEKVVENRYDFIFKTFITLSSAEVFIETYELPELWDRVFYSKDNEGAVVIAKNGKILTSYRINSTINDTLNKHKKFLNAKIQKIGK